MAEETFISGPPILPPQVGPISDPQLDLSRNDLATDYSIQELRILKERGFYGVTIPITYSIPSPTSYDTGGGGSSPYSCVFFIANRSYQILRASVRYQLANDVSLTYHILKAASGVSPGAATRVMTGTFNLGPSANNNLVATITRDTATNYINNDSSSILVEGDSLLGQIDGNNSGLHNFCLSVLLKAI